MPMTNLSDIPLEWYRLQAVPLEGNVFDTPPWNNHVFRQLCGLKPLRGTSGGDIDIEGAEDDETEYAEVSDGFALTKKAYNALKPDAREHFSKEAHKKIVVFLEGIRAEALRIRAFNDKSSGDTKRKRKRADDTQDCLSRASNIAGHGAFVKAVLIMFNLPDGVLSVAYGMMMLAQRTPLHAWRDAVEAARVEYSAVSHSILCLIMRRC